MWVYRAGKSSYYYDTIINNKRIYMIWDNLDMDMSSINQPVGFREIVKNAFTTNNDGTISNLSCQLDYFCNKMEKGDYVIIPSERSKWYTLSRITGNYEYKADNFLYPHSRKIEIIIEKMYRETFPLDIQYSLGAFRTIFHAKREKDIIKLIKENYNIDLE